MDTSYRNKPKIQYIFFTITKSLAADDTSPGVNIPDIQLIPLVMSHLPGRCG
jgi:hypothetical protein